jgi:hypothetical protein
VLPEIPTCATMMQWRPTITLCPICTRLSILLPSPMRVLSVVARSMVVFAPTSTSLPMITFPTCGTLWYEPSSNANPNPSAPMIAPEWRMQRSPTTHSSRSTTRG